jgi:hypothetical protein
MYNFYLDEIFVGIIWLILCSELLYIMYSSIKSRFRAIIIVSLLATVMVFVTVKVYELDKLTYYLLK